MGDTISDVTSLASCTAGLTTAMLFGSGLHVMAMFFAMLPSNAAALWWADKGRLKMTSAQMCKRSRAVGEAQQDMCVREKEVVREVVKGIELAIEECQHQFQNRHWNCNTSSHRSLAKFLTMDTPESAFIHAIVGAGSLHAIAEGCSRGQLLACSCDNAAIGKPKSRTTISSVPIPPDIAADPTSSGGKGIVTTATISSTTSRRGGLMDDRTSAAVLASGDWTWGGCTDDVEFAYAKSKEFIDVKPKPRNGHNFRLILQQHNHEAGRLATKLHMRISCKCHGMSGSCAMKTCWKRVDEFARVGDRLKQQYHNARQVTLSNDNNCRLELFAQSSAGNLAPAPPSSYVTASPLSTLLSSSSSLSSSNDNSARGGSDRGTAGGSRCVSGSQFRVSNTGLLPEDLVYSQESPNYCKRNKELGLSGTKDRQCDPQSSAVGSCEYLCCGRGYKSTVVRKQYNCECKFRWCCEVECKTCFNWVTVSTCK